MSSVYTDLHREGWCCVMQEGHELNFGEVKVSDAKVEGYREIKPDQEIDFHECIKYWKEKLSLVNATELASNINETKQPEAGDVAEKLTDVEKEKIKEETGWSDEIIDNIKNLKQYEILKNAELIEVEIDGKKCLIKENIDLDYTDEDGISNRDRISRGLAPIDSKTEKPLELHHLGQKADSPLVELTEEEHRTGEYEEGKKNQSLWHDNTKETEVHGEGNNWDQKRKVHWKERAEMMRGE